MDCLSAFPPAGVAFRAGAVFSVSVSPVAPFVAVYLAAKLRLILCTPVGCGIYSYRLPCPSPSGVCANSNPLSQRCHPTASILCRPFLLLPPTFPSIRVFSDALALHIEWPNYYSLSFSISLFNVYSGLISFRMDWFDLLAVQGTLKSLLQQCSPVRPGIW